MDLRKFWQLGVTVAITAGICVSLSHSAGAESLPLKKVVLNHWGPRYVAGAMDGIRFVHEEFGEPEAEDISACRRGWPNIRVFYDFKGDFQSKAYIARNADWRRWGGFDAGAFAAFTEFLEDRCVKRGGAPQLSLAELSAITGLQYNERMPLEHSKLYTEGLRDGLSLAALRAGPDSRLWSIAECPDKYPDRRPYPRLLFWIMDLDKEFSSPEPQIPHPDSRNVAELLYEYLVEKCPK